MDSHSGMHVYIVALQWEANIDVAPLLRHGFTYLCPPFTLFWGRVPLLK